MKWLFLLLWPLATTFWKYSGGTKIIVSATNKPIDCTDCPCGDDCVVCSGTTPTTIDVTFAGVIDSLCADCAGTGSYNDTTFTLTRGPDIGTHCQWLGAGKCGHTIRCRMAPAGGPTSIREVMVGDDPGASDIEVEFYDLHGVSFDCMEETDLPQQSTVPDKCGWASATCHINPN